MIKKILASSLFTAMLLFSGCGDSEGEDYLAIQQMLDKGDYAGVIAALENNTDKSDDDYIALGAAYMGKAGVSFTRIISAMASDDENNDAFAAFVKSIADVSKPNAISDLGKSAEFYKKIVADCATASINDSLNDSAKDICLFIGLGAITRTAVVIDSLVDDISTFADKTKSDEKLTATICAVQYDYNRTVGTGCSDVTSGASEVDFIDIGKSYTPITVTVTGQEYYYLRTDANKTVLTDGYCNSIAGSIRVDSYNGATAKYACPIIEDPTADELTIEGTLVRVFNEGIDSIGAALTNDIQEDINEFVSEIDTDSDGIDEADIRRYLNEQNNG